jgi:HD-GYP domain-containing protein (c-di-GMP phosphodiesterase class II)
VRGVTNVGLQRSASRGARLVHDAAQGPHPHEKAAHSYPGKLKSLLSGPIEDSPEESPSTPPTPSTPPIPTPERSRRAGVRGWQRTLLLVVAVGCAIAALVVGGPVAVALGALVLAAAAAISGWLLGDDRRRALQSEVDERVGDLRRALSELEIAQAETVRRLSMAVEFRDEDTGAHIERIGRFSRLLAESLGMSPEFCRRIGHAAPLHDVGKVAIPDAILLKPGALTTEERTIVETHAEEGHRLLRGSSSSILDMGASIALSHHERWDGGGYPRGLSGEEIPVEGRIVAIADVFDALTSHRVYRDAFSVEKSIEMMLEQSGQHFDPVLLRKFMEVLDTSGTDARARERANPRTLVASALETYTDAMRLGDAELAEEAIASAIEDGIDPTTLQDEVVVPAMRRIEQLREEGEIDLATEHRADAITRRVMATMNRYILARG